MKKAWLVPVLVAVVMLGFTCGFLIGRNDVRSPLTVSQNIATQPDATTSESRKVNINTASVEELTLLPGIGKALAQRIAEHRELYGPFKHVEDLSNVNGIGQKKLEGLLEYITVGGGL